jgi:hypothetical protein
MFLMGLRIGFEVKCLLVFCNTILLFDVVNPLGVAECSTKVKVLGLGFAHNVWLPFDLAGQLAHKNWQCSLSLAVLALVRPDHLCMLVDCCLQIDVGIKGVAPGYATQQFLAQKLRQCKFWGGMALAGLAVTANLFDQLCLSIVGTTLATTSLVIIVGAVMQTSRQVGVDEMQKVLSQQTMNVCCCHCCYVVTSNKLACCWVVVSCKTTGSYCC